METVASARQVNDGQPPALALAAEGGVRARVVRCPLGIAGSQLLKERLADGIDPQARPMDCATPLREGSGVGLVGAAPGAIGRLARVEVGRNAAFQIVACATLKFGPRSATGRHGPVKAALEQADVRPGAVTPLSVLQTVRGFVPIVVCTVH